MPRTMPQFFHRHRYSPPQTNHGFSLIEVLITVVILGILASIAYPSYESHLLKGRRAQARTALSDLLLQQERYMTQYNCYLAFNTTYSSGALASSASDNDSRCPTPAVTPPFKNFAGDSASTATYTLSASACTNMNTTNCIQLTATPLKSDPQVGALSITSMGAKSCTGTAASTNPSLCWP